MTRNTTSRGPAIEQLETRRLLAITIDPAGVVHATGTGGNDVIRIDPVGGQYRVTVNDEVQTFGSINGFALDGLAGNDWLLDTIPYKPGPNYLSRTMTGGDGNDNFWEVTPGDNAATISGGAGDDTVYHGRAIYHIRFDGGPGRDTLRSATSHRMHVDLENYPTVEDAFLENGSLTGNALANRLVITGDDVFHSSIWGNGGNDSLEIVAGGGQLDGGDGNDSLVGSSARETLDGGAGNDTLRANGGDDTLYGRAGFDLLDAGAGDDHLFGFGDGAVDTLLGGAGYDRASRDAGDSVSAIEEFVSQGAVYVSGGVQIGRAHVLTPVTVKSRMPSSA